MNEDEMVTAWQRVVVYVLVAAVTFMVVTVLFPGNTANGRYIDLSLTGGIFLVVIIGFLLRNPTFVRLHRWLMVITLIAGVTLSAFAYNGVRDAAIIGYVLAIVIAGFGLGAHAVIPVTVTIGVLLVGLYFAEIQGLLSPPLAVDGGLFYLVVELIVLLPTAVIFYTIIRAYQKSKQQADAALTANEQATHALLASEEKFARLFQFSPDAVFLADWESGAFVDVNESFTTLFNVPYDEVVGSQSEDYLRWQSSERARQFWDMLRAQGMIRDYRAEFMLPDESNMAASLAARRVEVGKKFYVLAFIRDMTARLRAAEALKSGEDRFRALAETTSAGIIIVDQEKLYYVNAAATAVTGYHRYDFGRSDDIFKIIHPSHRAQFSKISQTFFNDSGINQRLEIKIQHASKEWRWLDMSIASIDFSGKPALLITFFDITSRKEIEGALRDSERKGRSIIDQSQDGIVLADTHGIIVEWNAAQERITGISAQDMVGQPISIISTMVQGAKPDSDGHHQFVERIRNMKPEMVLYENLQQTTMYQMVNPVDGKTRTIQVTLSPILMAGGNWIASITRDVTDQLAQEAQLRQQDRLAAVGQLASGIAHDFNNIMAVITLYAQLSLHTEGLPEQVDDRLRTIVDQSNRAADLIQQILDFSRRSILEKQSLNLQVFLKEQIKLLQRTLPESITVRFQADADHCFVEADLTRLQQVMMNLALNARDAMPQGGELTVQLDSVDSLPSTISRSAEGKPVLRWIVWRVTDTGCGLSKEGLDHLFEPFYTTKRPGDGTGLGLAQVYGIVGQHDGYIEVDSEEGVGTTFQIYLPALLTDSQPRGVEEEPVLSLGNGERILVVEDDASIRASLVDSIEALGYQVVTAENGRVGLDLLHNSQQPIDMILSDVIMPQMDGVEMLTQIRAANINLPVVMLTGYMLADEAQRLNDLAVFAILMKPPDLFKLANTLTDALAAQVTP